MGKTISYISGEEHGIPVIIPVCGEKGKAEPVSSGVRVECALCRAKNGKMSVSADLNGAANIIRKALPHAFDGQGDYPQILVKYSPPKKE